MPYLLISGISFLSTVIIILIVFAIFGMAPFGNHGLLYRDGEIQMVDLFCWYKDVLTGKSSIAYTFTKSLGGSNLSVFTYYLASPLSLLVVFFNKSDVPLFMNILFILKAALAALFMGIYLTYRFEPDTKAKYYVSVILSVSYALNPFFITQSSNTMWLDGAYMLPLILLGAEKIARGKKSYLLIITAALAICFNWYSGIIDLMFCCFWFLFEFIRIRLVEKNENKPFLKHFLTACAHFALSCICSLLIASTILVPTLMKLSERTHGKGGLSMLADLSFIGGVHDVLLNYSFGMISLKGSVSLFAGSFVLLGVCLLFIASANPLKEKIFYGIILLFTVLMYFWQPLVALFSMLRVVESFWYRYTYLGVFALIFLASTFYLGADKGKIRSWMPPVTAAVFSVFITVLLLLFPSRMADQMFAQSFADLTSTDAEYKIVPIVSKIVFPVLISLIMCLVITNGNTNKLLQKIYAGFMGLLIVLEVSFGQLILADSYTTANVGSISDYIRSEEKLLESINDDSFYRVLQTSYHSIHLSRFPASYNEPMAFGFNSVTSFVSDPDENTIVLMDKTGYAAHSATITATSSENLAADSLMGVKYVLLPVNAKDNTGLEKLTGTDGFKDIYLNPYAFPAAFVYSGSGDYDSTSSCPALYVNDMAKRLSNIDKDLFVPATYTVSAEESSVIYSVDLGDDFDPAKYVLYANIPTKTDDGAKLTVNGEDYMYYSQFLSPSMVRIVSDEKNVTVGIRFNSGSDPMSLAEDAQFYLLDLSVLKEASEAANQRAADTIVLIDGYGKLTVDNAAAGDSLFISVPVEKGWTITRNGKEISCDVIGNALMSIPLENGRNEIEMNYQVPFMNTGNLVTVLGSLIFAAVIILEKINTRKPSKTHPACKKHN